MPRRSARIMLPTLVAASALALAGCSSGGGGDADADGLQVVATTTQVGDIVRQIAGDDADITQLLEPGQSAHSYDATPEALEALSAADVLVVNGAGLEEWLDDTIDASGFDGVVIDASEDVELHEGEGHDHEGEDHSGEEHSDEEHSDEEHADESESAAPEESTESEASAEPTEDVASAEAEEEHDHEHEVDPHVWSDPQNAILMAQTIGAGLADVDPDHADDLAASTDDYVSQLTDLDAWVHESIEQVPLPERLLVTNHDTFSYLADATGIEIVGNVLSSLDDNAEPSAAEIDELVAAIRDTGVKAVFSESSIDPSLAQTIADEAGVQVYSGEDALYADSLGPADSDGGTYIGSVIHNVSLIVESWGVEAVAVPDTLTQ